MRRATYLLIGGAGLGLALAAGQASAADPKFLGYLGPNQSGQVWAYPDASGQWCREEAAVSVLLTPQMTYAQVAKGLHTIGLQVAKECKLAASAKVAAYTADRSLAGPSFTIRKDDNWLAVAAAPSLGAPLSLTPPPVAAPIPPAPEPKQPAVLPRDLNYYGAMLRAVHDNPALGQEDGTLRVWAAYRFGNEYRQFQNQEFKLQPILQQAKADLADAVAHADTDHVTVVVNTQFGSYDFNRQRFPISLDLRQLNMARPCCFESGLPANFVVRLSDAQAISSLPMASAEAQAFTERRTRFSMVNRDIAVALTIKLDHTGFQSDGYQNGAAVGTVDGAVFYTDDRLKEVLYRVDPADLQTWREALAAEQAVAAKLAADRAAEAHRQQLVAQRDQSIRSLSSAPVSVKLANFIADGDLNLYARLDNMRAVRAAALTSGKAVPVNLLVQADSSGRSGVVTKWPGLLEITVAEGQPAMTSSGWYLVRGLLNVPDSRTLPPAQLLAQQVYACTQAKCAEATDATVIVDRKLAASQRGAQ